MQVTSQLLNGERVVIDVPDATGLGAPVRTSVLVSDGLELEVNAGEEAAADFYLGSTGSTLTGEVTTGSGMRLSTGALGGGAGLVFLLHVGAQRMFGPVPPGLGVEGLTRVLNGARPEATGAGPVLRPQSPVAWSSYRTHDVVVSATVRTGGYVLDVRRAFTPGRGQSPGVGVAGGTLTRSRPGDSRHVILDAPDHVVYGIPLPETDIDTLVESMSEVQVRLE